ncbi:hypothetical protein QFC21_006062 [Naganishia friedmannii]|uniref:Uncharacterized protein n=1 Tax=Naganishia friedmannii TaxID=89922 RepID=A0ACC2V5B6_9TREE|nr:hypothetical protein QFC21_006062 [Naganishia friedmannii]
MYRGIRALRSASSILTKTTFGNAAIKPRNLNISRTVSSREMTSLSPSTSLAGLRKETAGKEIEAKGPIRGIHASATALAAVQDPTTTTTTSQPFLPPPDAKIDLILPPSDTRPHRYLRLKNGLEVVLVSDEECDKAAAAMDVGVGHLEDPKGLEGCAHFCEHLLFLGTKKYPEENAYSTYLSAHNGHSNAYTGLSNTNYFFEVAPDALHGALDRFAGFFTEPLFDASCTEREANAVNSEHNKNLQSDMWRFYQLEKHLSSPRHPYHKFGTGTRETLWDAPRREGRDPRAELIEWWRDMYCAKRMKLVVMGRESLDTLEEWVKERFEAVPVKTKEGEERLVYSSEVLEKEQMGNIIFAEPVKDVRGLEMTFPFPDQSHLYATKPGNYLAHFLGHEGPGSVLSYLKRHGWVNSLRAGFQSGSVGFDLFKVTLDLTAEGLVHYKDVAMTIYKYIHLLRGTEPQEHAFQEIKALSDIGFRFVERGHASSYASDLSTQLQQPVPREKIISSQWLIDRFDAQELKDAVELLDIRRSTITVTAKTLPSDVGPLENKEPVYGTKYRSDKMPEEFITEALHGALIPELHLPGPNAFIPENLDVDKVEGKEPTQKPDLLKDTSLARLWHKKDDRFWVPRANVFLALQSPLLDITPRQSTLARMYCDLFRDSITEEVYDAELAGLQYSLEYAGDSITVGSVGYNDKLPRLTEKMLGMMKDFKVDPARFAIIKDQLQRVWTNFQLEEPYSLTAYYAHYAESERMWTPAEKLVELEHIKPEDIEMFAREFFGRMYIETLVHGNMDVKAAVELQEMVERVLSSQPLSEPEKLGDRTLLLPTSSEHVWKMKVPNTSNVNSSCEYYCQVGDVSSDHLRPRLSLLAQIANEPVFNVLRTKEQLGYLVFSGARAATGTMGFRVLLQSEKPAAYLETRVEAFFDTFKKFLEDMTEEEFETHKQGLVHKKTEKPKNLHGESARFWSAIGDGYYDFARRVRDVEQIKSTTKQEIIDLFMTHIHPSSTTRAKLSIHMDSQAPPPADATAAFDPTTAATSLVEALAAKSVTLPEDKLTLLLESEPAPGPEEIRAFAREYLSAATELPEEDRTSLEELIAAVGEADVDPKKVQEARVRSSNVVIEDIIAFKAGLLCSAAARPLEKLLPTTVAKVDE